MTIMTPEHPRWDEFAYKLDKACHFTQSDPKDPKTISWRCGGGNRKLFARRVLKQMRYSKTSIEASCRFFEERGGYCDCEILFNVDR